MSHRENIPLLLAGHPLILAARLSVPPVLPLVCHPDGCCSAANAQPSLSAQSCVSLTVRRRVSFSLKTGWAVKANPIHTYSFAALPRSPMLLPFCVALISFVAIALSSTVGFGSALLSMPLLTALLGLPTATPLFALIGSTSSIGIVLLSWRQINVRSAWQLLVGTAVGSPLGIMMIRQVPEAMVSGGLGLFLMLYGLYGLLDQPLPVIKRPVWGYGFGVIAGILGSAFNTNGPPVIVYGSMRRWPPPTFRATLQGYFLPAGLIVLVSHGVAGLWTPQVLTLYWWSLPGAALGVALGQVLNPRIAPERFGRLMAGLLIGLGGMLVVVAVR